jgi:hypothetical protein
MITNHGTSDLVVIMTLVIEMAWLHVQYNDMIKFEK